MLSQLLDEVIGELETRAAEAGVELVLDLADELPTIQADATQLQVALRAVCDNALEALADGRRWRNTRNHGCCLPLPLAGQGRVEIFRTRAP